MSQAELAALAAECAKLDSEGERLLHAYLDRRFSRRRENAYADADAGAARRRPGAMTAKYIDTVLTRLTVVGSLYILVICLVPEILRSFVSSIPFYFGGTSLLITVVVVMDFMAQLQAHLMSHQYEGLMKKANLKSLGPGAQG